MEKRDKILFFVAIAFAMSAAIVMALPNELLWSNAYNSTPANYSPTTLSQFFITWTPNASETIDTVLIEGNWSNSSVTRFYQSNYSGSMICIDGLNQEKGTNCSFAGDSNFSSYFYVNNETNTSGSNQFYVYDNISTPFLNISSVSVSWAFKSADNKVLQLQCGYGADWNLVISVGSHETYYVETDNLPERCYNSSIVKLRWLMGVDTTSTNESRFYDYNATINGIIGQKNASMTFSDMQPYSWEVQNLTNITSIIIDGLSVSYDNSIMNFTDWVNQSIPFYVNYTNSSGYYKYTNATVALKYNYSLTLKSNSSDPASSLSYNISMAFLQMTTSANNVNESYLNISIYNYSSNSYKLIYQGLHYPKTNYSYKSGNYVASCFNPIGNIKMYNDYFLSGTSIVNISLSLLQKDEKESDGTTFTVNNYECGGYSTTFNSGGAPLWTTHRFLGFKIQNINLTNVTFSDVLPGGLYYWKTYANTTSGSINTSSFTFTINQNIQTPTFTMLPTSPIQNGTLSNAICASPYYSATLYRNNSASSENGTSKLLSVGIWNYVCNGTNQNYTGSTSQTYIVVPPTNITSYTRESATVGVGGTQTFNISANNWFATGIKNITIEIYGNNATQAVINLTTLQGNLSNGNWSVVYTPSFCGSTYYIKSVNATDSYGFQTNATPDSLSTQFSVSCTLVVGGSGGGSGGESALAGCDIHFTPKTQTDFFEAGKTYVKTYNVENTGNVTCEGEYIISAPDEIKSYMSLDKSVFSLVPEQADILTTTVVIPKNALEKGYEWQILANVGGVEGAAALFSIQPSVFSPIEGNYFAILGGGFLLVMAVIVGLAIFGRKRKTL